LGAVPGSSIVSSIREGCGANDGAGDDVEADWKEEPPAGGGVHHDMAEKKARDR
jgi:hypothetical protein